MTTPFSNEQLNVDALAQVSAVSFTTLDPTYPWLNLTQPIPTLILLSLPIAGLTFVGQLFDYVYIAWTIYTLIALSSLISSFYIAKSRRYALREADLLFFEGILWQTTTAVAFNRIQHIDLTHGPLERKYNIATIKCFTAGGSGVDLKIPGLPLATAESLRAFILDKTSQPDATSIMAAEND